MRVELDNVAIARMYGVKDLDRVMSIVLVCRAGHIPVLHVKYAVPKLPVPFDLDEACTEAMRKVKKHIRREADRHLSEMREQNTVKVDEWVKWTPIGEPEFRFGVLK